MGHKPQCEMFDVKNRMIQIDYNFPKNNIQTLCECLAIEDMKHICECEIVRKSKNRNIYHTNISSMETSNNKLMCTNHSIKI